MKGNDWGQKLLKHQYPAIVFRFPWLIHLLFLWNRLTTLRVWYVRQAIRGEMRRQPLQILDIGVGEGQYLWWMKRNWPNKQYGALDKHYPHLLFAHTYRTYQSHEDIILTLADVAWINLKEVADFAICVGVLQYVEADEEALKRLYSLLKPGGRVLIYVPVKGKVLFGWYSRWIASVPHYEVLQARKRIYQPEEIRKKLAGAGFEMVYQKHTYGKWGIAAYELYNALFYRVLYGKWVRKILSGISLLFILPILWLMMGIDFWGKRKDGNGLLMVLEKRIGKTSNHPTPLNWTACCTRGAAGRLGGSRKNDLSDQVS